MHISVVSLFPELVSAVGTHGIPRRAIERGALALETVNPRDFTHDRHRTVDDRPFGGGPGMLMKPEPLAAAIDAARGEVDAGSARCRVVYLSPQGRRLDRATVVRLGEVDRLVLVCGRYEGVDQRAIDALVDEEISIGDYVLSGGELGAMVIVDAMARRLPGVLGHDDSVGEDSFEEGLLDHPHYTRPECWSDDRGGERDIPAVLRSGDHKAIAEWRERMRLIGTAMRRPDLFYRRGLSEEERAKLTQGMQS